MVQVATTAGVQHVVDEWLSSYIMNSHPELGRSGAICPFVGQARKADSVYVYSYSFDGIDDEAAVRAAVHEGLERFVELGSAHPNRDLLSLVLVFIDLPSNRWHLIDDVHSIVKPEIVDRGMMIGQFHPNCAAPAAHNSEFAVNRAPLPMFVLRYMAAHDWLFLGRENKWMDTYREKMTERRNSSTSNGTRKVAGPTGNSRAGDVGNEQ